MCPTWVLPGYNEVFLKTVGILQHYISHFVNWSGS